MEISEDSIQMITYRGRENSHPDKIRRLAIFEIKDKGETYLMSAYQSSGSNVGRNGNAKGMWFPTIGITADNCLLPHLRNGKNQITKEMGITTKKGFAILPSSIDNERNHSIPSKRLEAFNQHQLPFSVTEASFEMGRVYDIAEQKGKIKFCGNFHGEMPKQELEEINKWILNEMGELPSMKKNQKKNEELKESKQKEKPKESKKKSFNPFKR